MNVKSARIAFIYLTKSISWKGWKNLFQMDFSAENKVVFIIIMHSPVWPALLRKNIKFSCARTHGSDLLNENAAARDLWSILTK